MANSNHVPENVEDQKVVQVPSKDHVRPNAMAFVPLVVALIGLIGTFATAVLDWEAFPFTSQEVEQIATFAITVIGTLWAWFRNNNVTKTGIQRESVADQAVPKKNKKPINEK